MSEERKLLLGAGAIALSFGAAGVYRALAIENSDTVSALMQGLLAVGIVAVWTAIVFVFRR
jgi:hypothetical protein